MFGSQTHQEELDRALRGRWVKFDEGPVQVVLRGEEATGKAEFDKAANKMIASPSGKFRFAINVWSEKNGAQVLEGPAKLAQRLMEAQSKEPSNNFTDKVVEIMRVGAGVKTDYRVRVLRPITGAESAIMLAEQELALHEVVGWLGGGGGGGNDDLPF